MESMELGLRERWIYLFLYDVMGAERMIRSAGSHIWSYGLQGFGDVAKWNREFDMELLEDVEHFRIPTTVNPKFIQMVVFKTGWHSLSRCPAGQKIEELLVFSYMREYCFSEKSFYLWILTTRPREEAGKKLFEFQSHGEHLPWSCSPLLPKSASIKWWSKKTKALFEQRRTGL